MPTQRLHSLDAFRGITIAGMILVNNPGSWSYVYAPLRHAEWHGWTPTDLIFPFFLFVVGVAMAFSIAPKLEAGANRGPVMRRVLERSAMSMRVFRHRLWRPRPPRRAAECEAERLTARAAGSTTAEYL